MKARNLAGKLLPLALLTTALFAWSQSKNIDRAFDFKLDMAPDTSTEAYEVVGVSDGDTMRVRNQQGQELRFRLCGIDAPEKGQPLGKESTKHLRSLVEEGNGKVEASVIEKDHYGRSVAEIWIILGDKEKSLNEEQLTSGMAYVYDQYVGRCPNKTALESAQDVGKERRVGVWSGNYERPYNYRRRIKQ